MIRLHRLVLAWSGHCVLDIEVSGQQTGRQIETPLPIPYYVSAEVDVAPDALPIPALSYEEDPEGFYEPIRLRENTDYDIYISLPGDPTEVAKQYYRVREQIPFWPFVNTRLGGVLKVPHPRRWQKSRDHDKCSTTIPCTANFNSHVGTADLSIVGCERLSVEVACAKMGYFDDFKSLLRRVSEDLVELLFQIDSAVGLRFQAEEPADVHPSVLLFHLRRVMASDALPLAVETIINPPHMRLVEADELRDSARTGDVDYERLEMDSARLPYEVGGPLADVMQGVSPTVVPVSSKHDTLDTLENRYVKAVLDELLNTCRQLEVLLEKEKRVPSLREVHCWINLIEEWLSWPGWRDVGMMLHMPSNSQVLLRRNGYRDVLETDLLLRYNLRLPWERGCEIANSIGDIRPIFELYQYWCYFTLRRCLRLVCDREIAAPNSLYDFRNDRLQIHLRAGRASRLQFVYAGSNGEINIYLFYNREFNRGQMVDQSWGGSYSASFTPDYSILVEKSRHKHWLHFDAKYRLNKAEWERQLLKSGLDTVERELSEGMEDADLYNKSDLYKMHTYRDAVLGSRGAYILFPGPSIESPIFIRNPSIVYKSRFKIPSVGAFPLRPDASEAQIENLVSFLRDVISNIDYAEEGYDEEIGLATPGQ